MSDFSPRRRVAIVGVGYSTVGRNTGLTHEQLMIQSARAALEDAGLAPADVDGIATMGGDALEDAWTLGLAPLGWFATAHRGDAPAFVYPALQAIAAIRAGFCETCIVFRIIKQQRSTKELVATGAAPVPGPAFLSADPEWLTPFGAGFPPQWAGLYAQRHMDLYGTTEEHFGTHVIVQRSHAALNDDALLREPLTMNDYLGSRYISQPVRILDCDYPCDAGSAVIFTTEERARDLRKRPVYVEAAALSAVRDLNYELVDERSAEAASEAGAQLWARTDLRPQDVDCAQLYDGFTILVFRWLEALGFCGEGEAGSFVAGGNTALSGSLPVNTDGGACNVGRRHGANFCIEATRQLRGEAGARQVPDAENAVFSNAGGVFAGAVLLTRT